MAIEFDLIGNLTQVVQKIEVHMHQKIFYTCFSFFSSTEDIIYHAEYKLLNVMRRSSAPGGIYVEVN